jgi:hypothetical protein
LPRTDIAPAKSLSLPQRIAIYMSEIKKAGRLRTITLIILILMAIGIGYDRMKDTEPKIIQPEAQTQSD